MTLKIGRVVIHNFGPFRDAEVDFSQPGLTIVEGSIRGRPGCSSNGAGKSFLLESAVFALYGRFVRDGVKPDQMIHNDAEDGASVEVHLVGDPKLVRIVRYRGHKTFRNEVHLFVDGERVERGTNAPTDDVIAEQILGMDFTTFANSAAFGVRTDVRSFFTATDSERKTILETLLSCGIYDAALERARARQSEELIQSTTTERALESSSSVLANLRQTIATAEAALSVDELHALWLYARACAWASLSASQYLAAEERKTSAALQLVLDKMAATKAAHARAVSDYEAAVRSADATVRSADAAASRAAAERRALQGRKVLFTEMKGSPCPHCTQSVKPKLVSQVTARVDSDLAALEKKEAKAAEAVASARAARQQLKPPETPDFLSMADDERAAHQVIKAKMATRESDRRRYSTLAQERGHRFDEARRQSDSLRKRVETEEGIQTKLSGELAALQVTLRRLDFLVRAFGNSGLKSFLLEGQLPAINRQATRYARLLLGEGAVVRLTATKTLRSKKEATREEMTVMGSIPGCARTYTTASKGQQQRFDLAMLLALRDIVSARQARSFQQLFADELFDGLDDAGVDAVVELLREVSRNCSVILITHDPRLKSVGDRIIRVLHTGTSATIEKVGPKPVMKKPAVMKRKVAS